MRNIFDKEFVKEMDDFFAEIDRVIGKKPQPKMSDAEADYWEQKAELHFER
jgi:hypothetical protein